MLTVGRSLYFLSRCVFSFPVTPGGRSSGAAAALKLSFFSRSTGNFLCEVSVVHAEFQVAVVQEGGGWGEGRANIFSVPLHGSSVVLDAARVCVCCVCMCMGV